MIRWLGDGRKLSREQLRVLRIATARGEPMAISAVTLIEIAMLVSARKLALPLADFLMGVAENPTIVILPLTPEIAIECAYLKTLSDPMDRIIVATSRTHGLRLATSDQRIIDSGLVKTIN